MYTVDQDPIVAPYIKPEFIHFLSPMARDSAIEHLIQKLKSEGILEDEKAFLSAILAREELVSTGIGLGISVPHAKLEGLNDFFIAVGIAPQPGIEWNSIDGLPVRLIFLIGGPAHEQSRYLKILSALTEAIRSESFRQALLFSHHPMDVIKLFEGI